VKIFVRPFVGVLLLAAGVLVGSPSSTAAPGSAVAAPVITSPKPGQVIRDQSFNVFFTKADDAHTFRIYIDEGTSTPLTFNVSNSGAPINVPRSGDHTIRLANIDADGNAGTSSPTQEFTLVLPPPGPPGISINAGAQYTNTREVSLKVVWPAYYRDGMIVDNDGGFGNFQTRELSPTVSWTLAGSGDEKLPKTVYARFVRDEYSTTTYSDQTFTDDIVLDLTAPVIQTAVTSQRSNGARRVAAAKKQKVKIRANDKVSGVAQVQFAKSKAKPLALMALDRGSFTFKKAPRFVRVIDLAGNYSAWKKITVRKPVK
jgi:hypothetical protein